MKTLLVMPNYNYGGPYAPSVGLMCLSSYLKGCGFDVSCVNLNHYPPGKLAHTLRVEAFDIVATGGIFTYYPQIREVIDTTRQVSPRSRVVLGGPIASADPQFAMDSLQPDFLVLGEGEKPMADLIQALGAGTPPEAVAGLAFREQGVLAQTPPAVIIEDLDSAPWPDYEGFEFGRCVDSFSLSGWFSSPVGAQGGQPERIASIATGRGCPAQCTFCYHLTPRYRNRSIDNVIAEIEHLVSRYRINAINLWDDVFAASPKRLLDFCARIKPLNLPWSCALRVSVVTEDILRAMKEAGCHVVFYGLESASATVLRSMRKGISVAQIEKALGLTLRAGISLRGNFIFGDPAETWQTVEETLSFYRTHRRDFSSSLSLGYITPYPGTALYQDLKSRGRFKDLRRFYETGLDENGEPINMTRMPDRDFKRLIERVLPAQERQARVFGKVLRRRELRPNSYAITYRCPFCSGVSEGLLLAALAGSPVNSFKVTCLKCLQRPSVGRRDLLGLRQALAFSGRLVLAAWWSGLKRTRLFAWFRYHPTVDRFWNHYKEETVAWHISHPDMPTFQELAFLPAVKCRLRFFWELLNHIVRRAPGHTD